MSRPPALTPGEMARLRRMMTAGKTTQQIATIMGRTIGSIMWHRRVVKGTASRGGAGIIPRMIGKHEYIPTMLHPETPPVPSDAEAEARSRRENVRRREIAFGVPA